MPFDEARKEVWGTSDLEIGWGTSIELCDINVIAGEPDAQNRAVSDLAGRQLGTLIEEMDYQLVGSSLCRPTDQR